MFWIEKEDEIEANIYMVNKFQFYNNFKIIFNFAKNYKKNINLNYYVVTQFMLVKNLEYITFYNCKLH